MTHIPEQLITIGLIIAAPLAFMIYWICEEDEK